MVGERRVGLTFLGKVVVWLFVAGCLAWGWSLLGGDPGGLSSLKARLDAALGRRAATQAPAGPAAPAAPAPKGAFQVRGSSTIAKVMTKVADAFAAAGGPRVEVVSESTGKGFEALKAGTAPLAMASRPVKPEEDAALGGSMTDAAHEHVIGIDAVAVVVNARNPIRKMTVGTFRNILAGAVTRWEEVEGSGYQGEIRVYGYGEGSGITEIVKGSVLRGLAAAPPRAIAENGDQESGYVEADPLGIGYVSLAFAGRNKPLALADAPGLPHFFPNRFTVATESYPVTRRLYLYAAPGAARPGVAELLAFVKGEQGQAIVGQTFVPLSLAASRELGYREAEESPVGRRYPGATRLSTDFRFRSGSTLLDTKALADVGRIVGLIERNPGKKVLLFGFADSVGGAEANLRLSRDRARAVADELIMNGLTVEATEGFGSEHPVADNATAEGRERNRRVEIWIR